MRTPRLIRPALGFLVWASAFVVLYALLSLGCRFGWDRIDLAGGLTVQHLQLAVALFLHLGLGTTLVVLLKRRAPAADPPGRFLNRVAFLAALAALAASIFTYAGIFGLTACL